MQRFFRIYKKKKGKKKYGKMNRTEMHGRRVRAATATVWVTPKLQ
jgi:hypothetical protein